MISLLKEYISRKAIFEYMQKMVLWAKDLPTLPGKGHDINVTWLISKNAFYRIHATKIIKRN